MFFSCLSVSHNGAWTLIPIGSNKSTHLSAVHAMWGNVSAPGARRASFCDPCPTGGPLPLICWATLYGFAPWPPGHQQMF